MYPEFNIHRYLSVSNVLELTPSRLTFVKANTQGYQTCHTSLEPMLLALSKKLVLTFKTCLWVKEFSLPDAIRAAMLNTLSLKPFTSFHCTIALLLLKELPLESPTLLLIKL